MFDFVTLFISLFQKYKKEKVNHDSDIIHIRKRNLLHKNIPELQEIKSLTGESFTILQSIFNKYDPIKTGKISDNPKKYELLTKTVIYKLSKLKTIQETADVIYLEFSLWFKHEYSDFDKKEELVNEIYEFKNKYLINNPFSNNN